LFIMSSQIVPKSRELVCDILLFLFLKDLMRDHNLAEYDDESYYKIFFSQVFFPYVEF